MDLQGCAVLSQGRTNVYVQGVKQASRCKAVSLSSPNGYVYGLTAMAQIFDAHAA